MTTPPAKRTGKAKMSKTKRAKVVRAWAVVNHRGGLCGLFCHKLNARTCAKARSTTVHDYEGNVVGYSGTPHTVVKLTGTLPHKKGAKK